MHSELIWDRAAHAAFVDLVRHRGGLWCAFREGTGHVPGTNGVVRVLRGSLDGQRWESAALLDEQGVDLRDPKLSVRPGDGALVVLMGGSVYAGRQRVSMAPRVALGTWSADRDGVAFGSPEQVTLPEGLRSGHDWLWRMTWRDGVAWGVVYQPVEAGSRLRLVRSEDASRWEHVADLDVAAETRPNETTLRFLPDERMVALVRREGGDLSAVLGVAEAPFTEFAWKSLGTRIGGPDLLVLPSDAAGAAPILLAAGRAYDEGGARTAIWRVGLDGDCARLVTLPSAGDTSYPRMLRMGDGRLLCAYYSSHLGGRSAIHLVTLRLGPLLRAK